MLQLVAERLQRILAREVLILPRPRRDRVDHAPDQLLDAVLTLRRADLAPEILGDDDVGRLLRPGTRNLDVALLEDDLALLVADHRRPDFPIDLVERVHVWQSEITRELQTGHQRRLRLGGLSRASRGVGSSSVSRLLTGCGFAGGASLHALLRHRLRSQWTHLPHRWRPKICWWCALETS